MGGQWAVTFGTARRGLGGRGCGPRPLIVVPNVTTHPSTTSVPITICGFNVPIKGLI